MSQSSESSVRRMSSKLSGQGGCMGLTPVLVPTLRSDPVPFCQATTSPSPTPMAKGSGLLQRRWTREVPALEPQAQVGKRYWTKKKGLNTCLHIKQRTGQAIPPYTTTFSPTPLPSAPLLADHSSLRNWQVWGKIPKDANIWGDLNKIKLISAQLP